ncbi:MAG: CAP domain-containing protein [Butyribacter sp.]|nr:CAP domain-containing protein [bacterium]MDY3854523.1 CAP domain-containing protein [Butyribacter sp.]
MKKHKKTGLRLLAVALLVSLSIGMLGSNKVSAASRPAKPSFTVTKRTPTTATLKIKKKGKATGYHIYIKSSKKGKYKIIPSISRTVKIKKLKKTKVYYVKVRAYRTKGTRIRFGKFSKTIKIGKYKKPSKKKTTSTEKDTPTIDETRAQKNVQEVFSLVNKERTAAGLSPYTLDETLCSAAGERAKEIVEQFSHTRPDGTSCFTVLEQYNYQYLAVGENIAAGQSTPAQVVESWMNSDLHRQNIMSPEFTKIGIGYYESATGYTYYWVQMFSK